MGYLTSMLAGTAFVVGSVTAEAISYRQTSQEIKKIDERIARIKFFRKIGKSDPKPLNRALDKALADKQALQSRSITHLIGIVASIPLGTVTLGLSSLYYMRQKGALSAVIGLLFLAQIAAAHAKPQNSFQDVALNYADEATSALCLLQIGTSILAHKKAPTQNKAALCSL